MDYERIVRMLDKTFAWSVARTFLREEAEELTQEIMFQAIKSIEELRDDNRFEPWFWRLASITLKVFQRGKAKIRNTMSFDEVAALSSPDEYNFETDDEYQSLRHKIAQMSATYRDIIVFYYYDNLSCKTISQKLNLPEGTVTYRLSLARNKLKERYNQMNETILKPAQLKIRIMGQGDYNAANKPFPWQYIDDALSQTILWYSYREPKTIEELSELSGTPAYFIEDRVENLLKREAVIRPTAKTVQTNFLIFDKEINSYAPEHSGEFSAIVADEFYRLSRQLTESMLLSGLYTAERTNDEIHCLLSVMLLDTFISDYKPCECKKVKQRYDGGHWDYVGFYQDGSCGGDVGISMEKSINTIENEKLAYYAYHFAPFTYRRMMFADEIDVCHAIFQRKELTEQQKEFAAKIIADGYLRKNEVDDVVCAVPFFTKEQYKLFINLVKITFADFLPFYSEQVKKYLSGYLNLFPKHLKEATARNGFYVFIALFKAVTANWIRNEKINIPNDSICDVLIMM